jgi:DNA-binding NtrC family response regulator
MMTGYGTSQTSIEAIRAGAFDYLNKPLDLDELRGVMRKALAAREARDVSAMPAPGDVDLAPTLVGETAVMREAYKTIGRLAALDVPALIVGEHGTGKQLVAATIHENSERNVRPLALVDCTHAADSEIEAQLAATHGGTVHLEHLEALSPGVQAALARMLGRSVARGAQPAPSAVRVLASTEADLAALVESGTFNRELHAAIAVVTVRLPPLRERREDIPLLVRYFIQRFNAEFDRGIARVDDHVMRLLQEHAWRGNVAELESVIKRGCILARSDVVTTDEIGKSLSQPSAAGRREVESALTVSARTALQERLIDLQPGTESSAYHDILDLVETALVAEALLVTNGNQVKAAGILGVNRATLRKKMPATS